MTTPYDTALRIAERRLDEVRAAIGFAVDELARIESAHIAIDAAMRREAALASGDQRMTTERYFVDARAERARLGTDRQAAQARLEGLREQAVDCYGSQTAIEGAVVQYLGTETYREARAEQAMLDDLVAARRPARRLSMLRTVGGSPP